MNVVSLRTPRLLRPLSPLWNAYWLGRWLVQLERALEIDDAENQGYVFGKYMETGLELLDALEADA